MPSVELSEPLYRRVEQAAVSSGMTIEEIVAEKFDFGRESEPTTLTPDQIALVREGQAQIRAGLGITMERLEANLAQRKAERLREARA